jgi:hypothetical protein
MAQASAKARLSQEAVLKFNADGRRLKAMRDQAEKKWEIDGFKTPYESLLAEIASLRTKRMPAIWRTEALANYNDTEGEDPTFGEVRLTIPFPGSFAFGNKGWSAFDVGVQGIDQFSTKKSTKWGGSGGFGWGSFKIGGSAGGSTDQTLAINNTNNFSLKMSVTQIPLLRPKWFDPWFLRSEFWRFNPNSIEGQNKALVSDGGNPPNGLLVGWPTKALFVRDVEIGLEELKDETSELVQTLKAEGKGGWGFGVLNLGGSYERNKEEKKHKMELSQGKLKVEGMQLAGLLIEPMGKKSPNPKEGLSWNGGG